MIFETADCGISVLAGYGIEAVTAWRHSQKPKTIIAIALAIGSQRIQPRSQKLRAAKPRILTTRIPIMTKTDARPAQKASRSRTAQLSRSTPIVRCGIGIASQHGM